MVLAEVRVIKKMRDRDRIIHAMANANIHLCCAVCGCFFIFMISRLE